MSDLFRRSTRIWLEPDDNDVDSFINWNVTAGKNHYHAQVKVADCQRSVELYFDTSADGLHKINRIIETLSEFRDALKTGIKRREKAEP